MPDVDAWVIGHVVDYLSRPETLALTAQRDSPEIAELRLTKQALLGRQAELTAALTDPDMPITEVKAAAAVIREKIAAINARLDSVNNDRVLAAVMPDEDDRDSYYTLAAEERLRIAQQRFDKLSDDLKRAVIDKLCSVRILPGQGSRQKFRTDLVPVLAKTPD
jgi:hypothetical protein